MGLKEQRARLLLKMGKKEDAQAAYRWVRCRAGDASARVCVLRVRDACEM